jgi:hypothetical protein
VFANAIYADQSALFEVGFQLVLAGFVYFDVQVLTEWISGGDEGRAQDVVLCYERFELRAGLAKVHRERGIVVHDVASTCLEPHVTAFARTGATAVCPISEKVGVKHREACF